MNELITAINMGFDRNGWKPNKVLETLDEAYLSEDLAQWEKGDIVVDFGFYGCGVVPVNGHFAVYIVKNYDWENWIGKLCTPDVRFACSLLQYIAKSYSPDTIAIIGEARH